jgi:hypothetical protein
LFFLYDGILALGEPAVPQTSGGCTMMSGNLEAGQDRLLTITIAGGVLAVKAA